MPLLPGADALLILAVILLAGTTFGWLARQARLPAVTGQIIAGVLLGPSALAMFDQASVGGLEPLTEFALALIGVTVGAHLNIRRLRNAGRRLFWLLVTEAVLTPLIVFGFVMLNPGSEPAMALMLATLAVSTAPATIIALVRENRARGVFVKTLIAAVAINNMACIFLFEIARAAGQRAGVAGSLADVSFLSAFGQGFFQVGQAVLLGAGVGVLAHFVNQRLRQADRMATLSVISLLLTLGTASFAGVSPLAACLALGFVQTNLSTSRDHIVDAVFANFEPVILCVFFTLAGLHLSLDQAAHAGVLAMLFVAGRVVAKMTAANIAMRLAGATERVRRNLGLALIPQAGIAVGLLILVQGDAAFAATEPLFTAVVLVAVTVNEIAGPIATRIALSRSGEIGHDRARLVDFLQEENITTGLEADSMEHSIKRLVNLLIRSHELHGVDREALLRSIMEREAQVSTCLGQGLAVPHGELPEGMPMVGVMGLSREGLRFPTPDGVPVHCVFLLATPRGERDRHLEVLAAMARTLGSDPIFQQQLYQAATAAHAYDLLNAEENEDFNRFLEDPD